MRLYFCCCFKLMSSCFLSFKQSDESDPEDTPSPSIATQRKTISFSINVSTVLTVVGLPSRLMPCFDSLSSLNASFLSFQNSVAKPTAAALSSARVTARVDGYESRKPYGHWVPVKSGRKRKHTLAVSR